MTNALQMSQEEIEIRLKELEIRSNELNLRRAEFIRNMLYNPPFSITPETQIVFLHEVYRLISGHECLAMLPECSESWYTTTEICQKLGISTGKLERLAKAHGIKPPEGQSNEFGRWVFSKSKYSSREIPSFIYSEYAYDWFSNHEATRSHSYPTKGE